MRRLGLINEPEIDEVLDAMVSRRDTRAVRPNPERRCGVEVEISARRNALLGNEAYLHGVREG